MLDFVAVSIHVTVYAASSTFHMASALYVSAFILDILNILQRCDTVVNRQDVQRTAREDHIKKTLHEAIEIHVKVLK